jgi:hypothetical protein
MVPDDKSFLRKAEHELYTTDIIPPKKRSFLHEHKLEVPDDWSESENKTSSTTTQPPMRNTSIFKKIFFGSLGFLVVALIIGGISYLSGDNAISTKNVDLTITAKTFVDGGESLPVNVSIVNRNKVSMELATLVLEYPEGNGSNPDAVTRITRDIGSVAVGDTHNESFDIKLYGEENSEKDITAHIEFRVSGSNAVYDKNEVAAITIRTSPLRLTLDAPKSVIPNQEVPLQFSVVGNGTEVLTDTALVLQYPPGFTFSRATPVPTTGNTVWYLGDIPPGANRTITVYGSFAGGISEAKTIRASVGSQNKQNEAILDRVYNTLAQVIPLTNAFLDAHIVVEHTASDSDIVPISPTGSVSISIPWENTLSSKITNARLEVALSGTAYDSTRVRPDSGVFDSVNNKITWTAQEIPEFASVDPGEKGTIQFSLEPRQFSVGQVASNPVINLSINITGFDDAGIRQSAMGVDKKILAIGSDMNFSARTLHASGIIQNTGAMPPKVNTETTYTLDWQLTNSRNRVTGVKVSTMLPTYVSWKNVIVPTSEQANVTFNEVTRELVWNVGEVPAGTGTNLPPRTLSLKVGITPSTDQKGKTPTLTSDMITTGLDTFTNKTLSLTRRALNTQISGEGSAPGVDGIVQ